MIEFQPELKLEKLFVVFTSLENEVGSEFVGSVVPENCLDSLQDKFCPNDTV